MIVLDIFIQLCKLDNQNNLQRRRHTNVSHRCALPMADHVDI
jgi:hypothetical protein